MATTFNGTKNLLSKIQIPSGYTLPIVTEITPVTLAYQTFTKEYFVIKTTVQNAVNSVTMTNIFNDGAGGLNAIILADINADFDDGLKTIEAHAELIGLTHNKLAKTGDSLWLKNLTIQSYICLVKVYINVI